MGQSPKFRKNNHRHYGARSERADELLSMAPWLIGVAVAGLALGGLGYYESLHAEPPFEIFKDYPFIGFVVPTALSAAVIGVFVWSTFEKHEYTLSSSEQLGGDLISRGRD